ncbi:uncharacterized protein LOC143279306 [Babylonia areolata]|uniref:uncharacterized protein LOC143279306 n=1 Tax=Babylonia areolata TaxID=304850 RepID=UPI003FD42014
MAANAPPRSIQLRFIQKLQKELAVTTDALEYAVSKQWVAALQKFIEADETSSFTIPPISASDWDDNNMYVGEKSWIILASWYGLESQYPFRRRSSMATYVCITLPASVRDAEQGDNTYVLADNKLDFLTVHCCLLKDLEADVKQPYINIYFWESLDYIEFQIRCVLKINPGTKVRMWMSFSDEGVDILLENLHLYDRNHTSVGMILCQKYLDVLDALQKRQTAASPYPGIASKGDASKEDLSTVFVVNEWRLTLCLEVLSPILTGQSPDASSAAHAVPSVFSSLSLSNIFQAEVPSTDWDGEMKQLLDDSVSEFNNLVVDQRNKVEGRAGQLLKTARENYQIKEQQLKTKMDEAALQEKRLADREKELNERDHELNSKLAKFKSMLTEFLTNKGKFEKETAEMAAQNAITASKVELNVGGVRYTTSVQTLLKEEGSTLKMMFSGQHALTADKDGSYFIDRDGTHFRHILNFLRDGPASLLHLPPNDVRLLSELRTEAEHYQLGRMVEALRSKMSEGRAGGNGDFVSLPP